MWTEIFTTDSDIILQSFCNIMKTVSTIYRSQYVPDYLKSLFRLRANTRFFYYDDGIYQMALITSIEGRSPDKMRIVTAGLSRYQLMATAVQIINTKIRSLVTEYGFKKLIAFIPQDATFFLNDTLLLYQGGTSDLAVGAKTYSALPRRIDPLDPLSLTKRIDLNVEFF